MFEQAYRMLLIWRQRNGSLATFQVLGEALRNPDISRNDLAQKYCENDNRDSSKTGRRFRNLKIRKMYFFFCFKLIYKSLWRFLSKQSCPIHHNRVDSSNVVVDPSHRKLICKRPTENAATGIKSSKWARIEGDFKMLSNRSNRLESNDSSQGSMVWKYRYFNRICRQW